MQPYIQLPDARAIMSYFFCFQCFPLDCGKMYCNNKRESIWLKSNLHTSFEFLFGQGKEKVFKKAGEWEKRGSKSFFLFSKWRGSFAYPRLAEAES